MGVAGRAFNSPLWNPQQNYHTSLGDNRTGFGNAQSDALIEQIVVTLDPEARNELYKKLLRMIYEEVPEIPLFVPTARIAIHKRFDVKVSSLYPGYDPKSLQLRAPFRQEALK
jgi:peptide/nickel transport system substrate-binding protein